MPEALTLWRMRQRASSGVRRPARALMVSRKFPERQRHGRRGTAAGDGRQGMGHAAGAGRAVGRFVLLLQGAGGRAAAADRGPRPGRARRGDPQFVASAPAGSDAGLAAAMGPVRADGPAEQRRAVHFDRVRRNTDSERARLHPQCDDADLHRRRGAFPDGERKADPGQDGRLLRLRPWRAPA